MNKGIQGVGGSVEGPPYGINLFVASAISGESIEDISKAILPSFFAMVVCLLLFTYFPIFSMGLLNVLK